MKRRNPHHRVPNYRGFHSALVEAEHAGAQVVIGSKYDGDNFAQCEHCAKRIYESPAQANGALHALEAAGKAHAKRQRAHVYRCPHQNGYHIGRTYKHR